MNSIDRLTEMFSKFPGIGPRQARRFVYFLLSRTGSYPEELARAIENLKREISQCEECQRHFVKNSGENKLCSICSDDTRDNSILILVPRDVDLEAVEKSGSFNGKYFVLGGIIPILEKEPEKKIRLFELEKLLKNRTEIKEIVLAMNANNEGENTADFLKEKLSSLVQDRSLVISELGRGLSTGAELEYADPETLKNAFLHRTN
jgi:recombination protein RecR